MKKTSKTIFDFIMKEIGDYDSYERKLYMSDLIKLSKKIDLLKNNSDKKYQHFIVNYRIYKNIHNLEGFIDMMNKKYSI